MKKTIVLVVLLAGCSGERMKTVTILSDPSGARIEVNEGYIGITPIEVEVHVRKNGTAARDTKISALPISPGQVSQMKLFHGGEYSSDPIPDTILFDMGLRPVYNPNHFDVDLY